MKAQALEGNFHLHHVAGWRQLAIGLPLCVELEIRSQALGVFGIHLHAIRVGVKTERALLVVEGVDIELHRIVTGQVFAARDAGTHQLRVVLADEYHVQIVVIVREIGLRLEGRWFAIARLELTEPGHFNASVRGNATDVVGQGRCMGRAWNLQLVGGHGATCGEHHRSDDGLAQTGKNR